MSVLHVQNMSQTCTGYTHLVRGSLFLSLPSLFSLVLPLAYLKEIKENHVIY